MLNRSDRGPGVRINNAMPAIFVEYAATRLAGNIGYVRFNHFAEPVDQKQAHAATWNKSLLFSCTSPPKTDTIAPMADQRERICANCNSFFPDTLEPTENGICLADEAFAPYLDDLLENGDFSRCRKLIETKRFHLQQQACSLYEEAECVELPSDIGVADLIAYLSKQKLNDQLAPKPRYSFQDKSFAWLMNHDKELQEIRSRYRECSAAERRKAADFEYHAAVADQLFHGSIGEPTQPDAMPGEVVALAIDPSYAPAILSVGTAEHIYGRREESMRLLLDLLNVPDDTEDLIIIIDKAAQFLVERQDLGAAMKLFAAACETFPDEQLFRDGIAFCMKGGDSGT